MSVPRPAIVVAMVTLPTISPWAFLCCSPALTMMSASRSCCLALRTSCSMPYLRVSMLLRDSDFSTLVVPTRTGRPASETSLISSRMEVHFSRFGAEDAVFVVGAGRRRDWWGMLTTSRR